MKTRVKTEFDPVREVRSHETFWISMISSTCSELGIEIIDPLIHGLRRQSCTVAGPVLYNADTGFRTSHFLEASLTNAEGTINMDAGTHGLLTAV